MKFNIENEKVEWGRIKMFYSNDKLIRFSLYVYDDDHDELYFSNFFIDERLRNKGYGGMILNWVFNYAKSHSYRTITLNVVKGSWMQKWYERIGFRYIEDCDGEYEGNVWMRKEL